ncbi:LysR substrate-binding domain-containing protein [Devosia nitrariae]|uniref:LysR family transcriptional regulator n=1 Tax=Devosia nitrariae TaxID=2071872 RepID=A0ABQ5VZX2_9HYPH|nr:LysR substrate-binding domain-containing protein [Devosia nitrariae]GLQ53099.1 LysR family transcriptional regulator [Devosia nitrariae]
MLNLNDLALFVQVIDHRGFAAAARALGQPKSTLSKRVAELEKSLGAQLIHRTSRRFIVTDMGQDFYRHASAMLIEAEAAEEVVRGRQAEPSGPVRMTCSVPTAQLQLAEALPDLARAYPKLEILLDATDRFVDLVQEGYDIAIRAHFSPLPDSDLIQRKLATDEIVLVASPAYLSERGKPRSPADLADHDGLLMHQPGAAWELIAAHGEVASARPRPVFYANESVVLLSATRRGLGIVPLPSRFARGYIADGSLERVLPGWTAGRVTTTILTPHRRGQLPSVKAVITFLVERLSGNEGGYA